MADRGTSRRICIRVNGDDANDLRALYRWLSREEWFAQAESQQRLSVLYRDVDGTERSAGDERDGPPMGTVSELVLVLSSAALAPFFEDLYARAKVAVQAWADNSSTDERDVEARVAPGPADGDPSGAGPDAGSAADDADTLGLGGAAAAAPGPDDVEGGRSR